MYSTFTLYVLYHQLAVCDPDVEHPFNDWSPQHVAQGFSWRPESVCFGTLDCGRIQMEIAQSAQLDLKEDSQRAIIVPFTVKASGIVEIATIVESEKSVIAEGNYALLFEHSFRDDGMWCRITFIPDKFAEPKILRADAKLSPRYPLLMEAQPAL